MNYVFKIGSIFIFVYFTNILPTVILSNDQFPTRINEFSVYPDVARKIVKRSVGNGLQLTKIFKENNRQYSCQIDLAFLDSSHSKQVFFVVDDTTKLAVSQVSSSGSYNTTSTNIMVKYNFTGNGNFVLTYVFVPNIMSGTEVRNVTVFDDRMNAILSQAVCLMRANFNDTVRTNLPLICCFFLALIIVIVIFIIIWIQCCLAKNARRNSNDSVYIGRRFSIQKYSLLLEEKNAASYNKNIKHNKTFADALITNELADIQYNMYELEVKNSRDIDEKLQNDFSKFNDLSFTILLNSLEEQSPDMKDRLTQASRQVAAERDNIRKKYQNIITQKLKDIQRQIIEINNVNLKHLKRTQESERIRILKLVTEEDRSEVDEALNKLFDQETRNLIVELRLQQDESIEEIKMKEEAEMANEINMCQLGQIKTLVKDLKINFEDGNALIKRYVQWQQNLKGVNDNERNRQASALTFLLENRKIQATKREDQNKDISEILYKKIDSFNTTITELEENDEISQEMSSKILAQFKKDKELIIAEMEKSKDSQLKALLEKLNEAKRKKIEDLKVRQRNEVDNLITTHSTNTDVGDLLQDLVKLELRHSEELIAVEADADVADSDSLVNIFQEIGTQTLMKINDKIVELASELSHEGFSERDIKDVIGDSNRKTKKIQSIQQQESEKQKKILKERLQKIKKGIEVSSLQQGKEQNHLLEAQNEVLNELMNMQKTLSDSERSEILAKFIQSKISMEKSLTASRLMQRRKMNELINVKKAETLAQLDQDLDGQIKKMSQEKPKMRGSINAASAISRCVQDFVEAKLSIANKTDSQMDLDKEVKKMETDILTERATLIHKKEEEIASLLNKIQLLKATEHADLKEQQDKLMQLQMAALDSIEDSKNVKIIMKKRDQDKEKLDDAIFMNKKQQEEQFQRRLKKRGPMSLLKGDSLRFAGQEDTPDGGISSEAKQNLEDEKFQINLKSENDLKQFEVEFLKDLVRAGNFPRVEVLNMIRTKFPLMTNQEVEEITEQVYPKSQQTTQKPHPRKSLIESLKKIDEGDRLRSSMSRPGSSMSTMSAQGRPSITGQPHTANREDFEIVPKPRKKKKQRIEETVEEYEDAF